MIRRSMGWPLPLLLAARYLKSSRRDAYVSLLSALAGGGIALGVAALILVLAGLSGLQHFLRQDVLARTPHLEVELPPGAAVDAAREAVAAVPGVAGVRPLIHGRGWLLIGGSAVDMSMVGFEEELPAFFAGSALPGEPSAVGSAPAGGVYVGELFAARWGLEPGDRVEVASTRPTLTPFGQQPRLLTLRLSGTFTDGRFDSSQRMAIPLAAARRLFGADATRLDVRTGTPADA
ncbi:MAG: ABC transporter permease, partial [Acidobacteriota bacterium]